MIACTCTKPTCKFPKLRVEGGRYPTLMATLNNGDEVMMYVDANGLVVLMDALREALLSRLNA